MENVPAGAEGRLPEVTASTEAEEIAQLLEKRAHCPHHFRYAMMCEMKKTKVDIMFTWCEHCGVGMKTTFPDEEQDVS